MPWNLTLPTMTRSLHGLRAPKQAFHRVMHEESGKVEMLKVGRLEVITCNLLTIQEF
jgi:hypothetical protein